MGIPGNSKRSTTLQHLFNMDSDQKTSEIPSRLTSISSCGIQDQSGRDSKTMQLKQLLVLIKSPETQIDCQDLSATISFISTNLLRPLPPPSNHSFLFEDQMVSTPSPLWQHLQIVYDVLLTLILKIDIKILCNYINRSFLGNLINLFQSEDQREREKIKNLFYQIYSKFPFHRPFLRKSMNDFLLHCFDGTLNGCIGISELLEIYGSIINGFTLPLKEEHKVFLTRVLIPLHKTDSVRFYHRQLCYCLNRFVVKEPQLGLVVVKGILRYWPARNCQKEVLFIGEVEEVVEIMDPEEYPSVALPLCSQVARCFNSSNTQIAERALYLWNNEQFVRMTSTMGDEVMPLVVEAIESNLRQHWSKSVKNLTGFVKNMLQETEPNLYQKCLEEIGLRESMVQRENMERREKWKKIESAAGAGAGAAATQPANHLCGFHEERLNCILA